MSTHRLTGSPAHRLTGSPAHRLTGSPAHRLTGSPAHRLFRASSDQILGCASDHRTLPFPVAAGVSPAPAGAPSVRRPDVVAATSTELVGSSTEPIGTPNGIAPLRHGLVAASKFPFERSPRCLRTPQRCRCTVQRHRWTLHRTRWHSPRRRPDFPRAARSPENPRFPAPQPLSGNQLSCSAGFPSSRDTALSRRQGDK
jgi:hypothetical protein